MQLFLVDKKTRQTVALITKERRTFNAVILDDARENVREHSNTDLKRLKNHIVHVVGNRFQNKTGYPYVRMRSRNHAVDHKFEWMMTPSLRAVSS